MKTNKYQITGIKGRLLHPGFVTCYLLIVLLYACNGGYEPSVRDDSIWLDESFTLSPTTNILKFSVHIPSKIYGPPYRVTWSSDSPNVEIVNVVTSEDPETPKDYEDINEKTTFIITLNSPTSTSAGDTANIIIKVFSLIQDGGEYRTEEPPVATAICKVTIAN